ncbi:hypothetical protein LTR16_001357 [Cryomyces antarcticus]|uniref:Myosin-binding domain-containing protein n=2 Tax=Cryomyces antarcticus TaxID=329879 RepID=A0ABR0LZC0_9PEZI|nr:hypothetical protein LTR16_001357 [Cryomyces antarcticus]
MKRNTRRTKPQLSESWGTVDGDEDDSGETADVEEQVEELSTPIAPNFNIKKPEEEDDVTPLPKRQARPSPRSPTSSRSSLKNNQYEGTSTEPLTPRRSARGNPRLTSTGPELIFPSLYQELQLDSALTTAALRVSAQLSKRNDRLPTMDETPTRPPPRLPRGSQAPEHVRSSQSKGTKETMPYLQLIWKSIISPTVEFIVSVCMLALSFLRPLMLYFFALWLIIGLALMARNFITSSFSIALSPLCRIPGSSFLNLPFCTPPQSVAPVEFGQLIAVQSNFEEVLSTSAGGASLPLDMKRSEASIRDLKHVVRFSTLPSRNELVFEFTGFIETARQASSDLTRFNSRIGRAVDHILSTNRWTLQVIDGVEEHRNAQGSVSRFLSTNLNIFAPFQPAHRAQDVLLGQYLKHASAVEEEIARLIMEAQALLGILQNLDDRLDIIAGVAARDDATMTQNKDELFAQLWTKLGGNRSSVSKLNEQLNLLTQVGVYRKTAWAHVSGTILKLQAIAAGLEDLRERVAIPETVGATADVPLSQHIDFILRGVERLEAQRDQARKLEAENHRRIFDRAGMGMGDDRMIESPRVVDVKVG